MVALIIKLTWRECSSRLNFLTETPLGLTLIMTHWDLSYRGKSKFFQCEPEKWIKAAVCREMHTHTHEENAERNLAGLSKECTSLARCSGLASQICSLESRTRHSSHCSARDYWQVPVVSSCQKLAPHEPEVTRSLQFCFISYVWQAKWWALCLPLTTPDIAVQAVLDNEAVHTSLLEVSREITNSPLTLIKIIWKIDWVFFCLGFCAFIIQCTIFFFFFSFFNIVLYYKKYFFIIMFFLGDVFCVYL